jgi:gamma-glutamylcyclotransferase (GGCT)/AIG2-like uncharacterized protein YtfP
MLYFAYGHNTNDEEMRKRVPDAVKVGKGWLRGYQMVLYKYASIKPAEGFMPGVVWDVTPDEMQVLDEYEEVPKMYRRRSVMIEVDGKRKKAEVYVMRKHTEGPPSKQYLLWLQKGYTDNGLF